MKIIIGLGNPGKEYENTRHNIGFRIVDSISKEFGGEFILDKKPNAEISEVKLNGQKVLLAKPQTFMNKSGEAIVRLVKSLKFQQRFPASHGNLRRAVSDLIVVHDDLDIPFGRTKISFARSSAGHKGVESVMRVLKTDKFFRLRFGTSNQQITKIRKMRDKIKRLSEMNKFVIGPFSPKEKSKLNKIIKEAVQKIIPLL